MNPSTTPILRIHALTAGYPRRPGVLRDICGGLSAGRLTAWVGPNGAGKSTLLRACLGALPPEAGRIELHGRDLAHTRPGWRAQRLAYVPQQSGLAFAFTVGQVVAMGRHGRPDQHAVTRALTLCGLEHLHDRPFNELSGGQQRLVLIARAWAQSRGFLNSEGGGGGRSGGGSGGGVVLADEPTAGLDLEHAERVMGLLRSLAEEGLAVAVVLHDLNHAARFADDIWLLHHGRLIAQGPPEEVLTPEVLEPVYGVKLTRLAGPPSVLVVGEDRKQEAGDRKQEAET